MTVPVFPSPAIRSVGRTLRRSAALIESTFSGDTFVQDWRGAWWEYEIEIAPRAEDDARVLSAFFTALGGPVGTFLLTDPAISNPTGLGIPRVNGAGQTGSSLVTDGWTGSGLRAGDFFSLGTDAATRLYQVTADAVPSGGAATLQFAPALRSSPADDALLNVVAPQVHLRLRAAVSDMMELGRIARYSFSAREAL